MSLQQIQREMEEELKIDRLIEKKCKKLLNKHYHNYKKVEQRDEAHALLVFTRKNLKTHHLCLNEANNRELDEAVTNPSFTVFFLKCKNPHDGLRATQGNIKSFKPVGYRLN